MLRSWLVKKEYNVDTATNVEQAKQIIKENPVDMILSDIRMPETDGFSLLSWVKKYDSDILVIMMTGFADIESAVESMKSGAVDYIPKPIDPELFFKKIEDAFRIQNNRNKSKQFAGAFIKPPGKEYEKLFQKLDRVIENNEHLMIIGDRGTGKVSVARYVYERGLHAARPFTSLTGTRLMKNNGLNSRTYNDAEGESVLMSKFKSARGGLLFIYKVHDLDIHYQNELLCILKNQKKDEDFTQIIVCTEKTKTELERSLIPKLYQFLENNYVILPTLKGKKEEILFFTDYFLRFANVELNKNIQSVDPEIYNALTGYSWPGNIQELKNTVIKIALLTEGPHISGTLLPNLFVNGYKEANNQPDSSDLQGLRKENYEKEKIREALELARGNKTMAASILNIDRKTLYNKIKLYNVKIHH